MKDLTIVGNWKSNKTISEAQDWIKIFANKYKRHAFSSCPRLALCAPLTLLSFLRKQIDTYKLPISLGAQDVSSFPSGSYTGEVSASMLKEFVKYVIIGHTERRRYFNEKEDMLQKKAGEAKKNGIYVIFCVSDYEEHIPQGVDIVAYEPVFAIGTGKPDSPENANRVIAHIKEKIKTGVVIYGGSVTPENVQSFTKKKHIDGVLPGGASLDPNIFYQLIFNATR